MTGRLPRQTRALVIGGGPVGLVLSGLLSRHGVEHVVLERRRETQRAPAAHVLRHGSMEILAKLGVCEEIQRTAPPLPLDFITWCTTLGGVEVGRLDLRPVDPETGERRPEPWVNCSQNLLEPILLRSARSRPEAHVAVGTECLEVTQDADRVSARVRRDDGAEWEIEATWAIAADGAGSPTRRSLGLPMEGVGPLGRFTMVHFEADLTPWIRGRPGPLFWIMNPESPGTLIVHDPKRSHVFMMPRPGDSPGSREEETIPERLAAALNVPVTPKILSMDAWSPHVQVARHYREGRVLLVGDAAHRFPPTGGLGLNTGIHEADVLASVLAKLEAGPLDAALLDTYEAECRPAARANAAESFENLKRLGEISRVIGASPSLTALVARIDGLDPTERRALDVAIESQRSHFVSDGVKPGAADDG